VLSPSKKFFLDTHSSIDRLPTVELRRSDGALVRVLTRGRLRKPEELKWTAPEEFVVKAADGESDLHGVLFKPWDFDPARSYPVVEAIYNGPQTPYVARSIGSAGWTNAEAYHAQALAQLGFVVVMVDGRGTPERGKAFQDVVYRKFGRFEVDDHSAVLRQLRTERPYMDLSRVGIYGGSWGGYFATRALLLAPELYKVGVAAVPAHPTGWIHEPYLGPPEENESLYAYAKNETHVDRLQGKLLFITGTSDFWYPDLMKLLEAFVLAGKPYDLVLFPDGFHNLGLVPGDPSTDYYWDALRRYFQEHLKP
jgi:dipeptidyl aminopeptidase/acylaminoacyl peptidase